jgi:hypothetical protein
MSLGTNLSSKAVVFAAVATLAACSRNPQPNVDETGRADTTMVTDTTRVRVNPSVTPADTMRPRVNTPDTSMVHRDTTVVRPDTTRRDTTVVRDSMPYPRNVPDTTNRPPSP